MSSPSRRDADNDEETSLLTARYDDASRQPTPLPTVQLLVLLLPSIAEAVMFSSMSPYINQLVRELPIVGGDARKVGYYIGIITSLHYVSEAATALYWNRLSDHIGRKPVILFCFAGTTTSMVLFGFSRSFWMIVLSRCMQGGLRGNPGVARSAMAELTDETNVAKGFSSLMMAYSIGGVIGSLLGGTLSRPQDHWPHLFPHPFWAKYPYLLPCLVVAAFCCMSWVTTATFLNETMARKPPLTRTNSDATLGRESSNSFDASQEDTQKAPPLRTVLTRPVLISLANYTMIMFLDMGFLRPLIWSTPVEFGGLDFSPLSIGLWLTVYSCVDGVCQFFIFPRLVARFGLRRVFITCVASFAIFVIMFPLENFILRHDIGRQAKAIWPLIVLQLLSYSVYNMGYSAVMIYISSATPNKRSLGVLNGLGRTILSVQAMIKPAIVDSLFAFSVTNNVLGGNLIYVVLLSSLYVALSIAAQLPKHMWVHSNR